MLLAGTKVQILTQRFLRPRYSVYWLYWYKRTNTDAGGAAERLRPESSHSSSDLLLDRERSGELAQEPLPLQPLALHVSLSALAARKLDKPSLSGLVVQKYLLTGKKVQILTWPVAHSVHGEQDEADSRRTSSNTSGGEAPGKFENPCNTLPLQTRSCASPDAKRHRGSGSSDMEAMGLSLDKEGGSDALVLPAQVEDQQQQQQVSCCCA
jgi:hypothetical protein